MLHLTLHLNSNVVSDYTYKHYSFLYSMMCLAFRAADVAELLGMMVEDHKRIQPNARTYA